MNKIILWTRDHEEYLDIRTPDAGNCTGCAAPLAEGWFRWTPQEQDPYEPPDPFAAGDGRFPALRHADGTPDCAPHGVSAKPRCPQCKSEALTFDDGAYGTTARCSGCGWNKYTDRGD